MRTDKILFGATCLAMGFIISTVSNSSEEQRPKQRTTLLSDSARFKPALEKDTICLTNAIKSDTLKLLKVK